MSKLAIKPKFTIAIALALVLDLSILSSVLGIYLTSSPSNRILASSIHGMTVQGAEQTGYLKASDYARIKSWGINSVIYELYWDGLENQDGSYIEANLQSVRSNVNMAKSYGLIPFLGLRITLNDGNTWVDKLGGADYVNMNSTGRQHYLKFLQMIASRFSDCGICPWWFPYHADQNGLLSDRRNTYYHTTFPALLSAIRSSGNDNPVVFEPIYQGWNDQDNTLTGGYTRDMIQTSWYSDPLNNLWFQGFPHIDAITQCGTWDRNIQEFNNQWQGLWYFMARSPGVQICSVEFNALATHGMNCDTNGYPEASRLEYFDKVFQYQTQLHGGWWFYVYEQPPPWWGGPTDSAGNNTTMTEVITRYATQ